MIKQSKQLVMKKNVDTVQNTSPILHHCIHLCQHQTKAQGDPPLHDMNPLKSITDATEV